MRANLSIMGAYLYNPDLFEEMALPEAMVPDKQNIVDNLVAELAELELVHTNMDTFPALIGVWSKKQLPVWEELYKTLLYEYNPINNYDRKEQWKEKRKTVATGSSDSNSTSDSNVSGNVDNNSKDRVAGMNDPSSASSVMADRAESEAKTKTSEDSKAHSIGHAESLNTNDHENEHEVYTYGNVGVTTTQEMIQAQREVVLFNMTDVVITDFKKRFCLPIY